MKAMLIRGEARDFVWSEVEKPVAKPGEIVVEVHAAALNRADLLQRAGKYPPPPGWPEWMGLEVSGIVHEVGEGVTRWHVGDKVCALLGGGGYAEYAAVPEGISVGKLLARLQREKTKIAVVVDEHGGTAGIVTMSDVMEQIVGRLDDEYAHDSDGGLVELAPDDYLIDGSMPIGKVVELIGFAPEEAGECETAGGLLLALFDRIPDEGDSITVSDGKEEPRQATFTVVDMDNLRIYKIRIVL